MFHLWLVYRFLSGGRRVLSAPTLMSLLGMALGVASLTVAMGVVSGFELTLRNAIIDVFGDIAVMKRSDRAPNLQNLISQTKRASPEVVAATPFVQLEGILAGQGKVSGVVIQGFDPKTVEKVLNLRSRVINGELKFGRTDGVAHALVGKTLAQNYSLKVGQVFKAVLPTPSRVDSTEFTPRVSSFKLVGIIDLGKAEYDDRYVVTDIKAAQDFADIGEGYSGLRLKVADSSKARDVSQRLQAELGTGYMLMDWSEVNENLFRAVVIERLVIFIVIAIIVILASFNIASNLFVSVLRRYSDISLLRAVGFSMKDVQRVFIIQGLAFGVAGTLAGFVLGVILAYGFEILQNYVVLLPAETYHIGRIGIDLRPVDVIATFGVSILICFIASYVPARKAAQLNPVEGLRYE